MTYGMHFVGLDVGGTTMKAAVVSEAGELLSDPVVRPTEPERGQQHGLSAMTVTIRDAIEAAGYSRNRIAAIGVATPGTMDLRTGVMLDPPNMKPWHNVPVRDYVTQEFGVPIAFQNDANAAAYGEFWVGAGRDARSLVLFTLGTGIGGGIVIDGQILEGEHSHGGELGHIKIEFTHGRLCGCGRRGCLEAYASATAVVARARDALADASVPSSLRSLADDELAAEVIFNAAHAGDRLAQSLVDDTARYLAIGAATAMHVIDPEMIIFGGGMMQAGEPFLERIRQFVHEYAFPIPAAQCQLRTAALGVEAGIVGAAGCARQLYRSLTASRSPTLP